MKKGKNVLFCCLLLACMATPVKGQQTTFEKLNRGTVAVKTADGVKIGYVPRQDNVIFARLMDAGKLLFGRISEKEKKGKWVKISIDIFLHE